MSMLLLLEVAAMVAEAIERRNRVNNSSMSVYVEAFN